MHLPSSPLISRRVLGPLALACVIGIVTPGCSKPSTAHVYGTVTTGDGKPLPGGTVMFYPTEGKTRHAQATIKDDGSYDIPNAPTGKVKGIAVHADDNGGDGVTASRISLRDSTANGNDVFGVRALKSAVYLVRTTVTGSGVAYADVASVYRPHLTDSTCGTSAHWIPPSGFGGPWGVCSGD